jgi:hypothetical protein
MAAGSVCELNQGGVEIENENLVNCNGTSLNTSGDSVKVTGESPNASISVTRSSVTLFLSEVNLSAETSAPVFVSESSVVLKIEGTNFVGTLSLYHAGVECSSDSNITVTTDGGSLLAQGGPTASGVGTGFGGKCGSVSIVNGSVGSFGGTGIGCGSGNSTESSFLGELRITDARIESNSSLKGSGIGSGFASGLRGSSRVGSLVIENSTIETSSAFGCGIGTGTGDSSGTSSVGLITIYQSNVSTSSLFGCGIGSGSGESGAATIGRLLVLESTITTNFLGQSSSGSSIGTGLVRDGGASTIESLTIDSSHFFNAFSADYRDGSLIGTGAVSGTASNSSIGVLLISGSEIESSGDLDGGVRPLGLGFVSVLGFRESTISRFGTQQYGK